MQVAGLTQGAAQNFCRALTALSIASKVWKLVTLYTDSEVEVTVVGANPIHAPLASEGVLRNGFQARAGVSDREWQEYQVEWNSSDVWRGLRDCFGFYGLPVMPDVGDMAKDVKDWKVEWRVEGAPEWVRINMDDNTWYHPGILRMRLEPDGECSAAAILVVEILPEKGTSHTGQEKQARAVASATVHTAKPPSAMTWANAIRGGLGNVMALANALTELCAGWIAEMVPPKAYAPLTVTYHEGGGEAWSGRITYEKTRTLDDLENGKDDWGYAFMLHDYEDYAETATVDIGRSELKYDTGQEKRWDLSGSATAIFREEILNDHSKDDNGCEGDDIATSHERSYYAREAGGNGPAAGYLEISSDGTYMLAIDTSPEMQGQRDEQYDAWWDRKPCVEDETHTQDSEEWTTTGPAIYVEGRLDPKYPGVVSGHYQEVDDVGYTVTITWNLRLSK